MNFLLNFIVAVVVGVAVGLVWHFLVVPLVLLALPTVNLEVLTAGVGLLAFLLALFGYPYDRWRRV